MPRSADRVVGPGPDCALVVFAKAPIPGTVKTRLVPPLTPAEAAHLHAAFLDDTVRRVASLDMVLYLAYAPTPRNPVLAACARRHRARTIPQGPGDLGARMQRVTARLLLRHPMVVIIGTDSPTVPIAYIDEARRQLARVDLVFGPSEDGGYYLAGQRRLCPEIFLDIAWGGSGVLAATLDRVEPERVALLPRWYDVDRPEDLARLRAALRETSDCPKTRAWFHARERGANL